MYVIRIFAVIMNVDEFVVGSHDSGRGGGGEGLSVGGIVGEMLQSFRVF